MGRARVCAECGAESEPEWEDQPTDERAAAVDAKAAYPFNQVVAAGAKDEPLISRKAALMAITFPKIAAYM